MQSQSDSPDKPTNSLSQLVQNMFSNLNNSNFMLAAIVSLLLVILFVLLLHVYAKLFLAPAPARRRRRHLRRTPLTVDPTRFHHLHFRNIEDSPISTKGLDSSIVSGIPMFVYEEAEAEAEELECVICLSGFEEGEIGRSLPKCGHSFHVECIDMWLSSHCNCPLCRAPIVNQNDSQYDDGDDDPSVLDIVISTPSYEISESGNDNHGGGGVSGDAVSQTSSSLLGSSLKRMLSKVFQSSNVNELDGSQQ